MKQGIFYVLLCIIFSFRANASNFPDWALTPPGDDRLWFYSVGAGNNVTDARTNALADLTSRLSVTVQSTSQQLVSAENNNADFYLDIDTKQRSNVYTFNRVEVLQQYLDAQHNMIYVLTRINKDSFFEQLHQHVLSQVTQVSINAGDNKALQLEKLILFNWQKRSILQDLALLKAYQQDTDKIDAKLQILESQFANLANNTPISVITQNTTDNNKLGQWLNKAGFNLSVKSNDSALQVLMTNNNQWQGQDDFQFAHKQKVDLAFVFNSTMLYQKTLSAIAFAPTKAVAKVKASQKLLKQLNTN